MNFVANFFSFPLLGKELTETAARRRTYVLRIVYALLLFGIFFGASMRHWERATFQWQYSMGIGSEMLDVILILEFWGIALFLPAMMCGRITAEKERDSLSLLFLTNLSPWSITLQKYFGGLVPMFAFLFLALPLTAIAFAFGGVTSADLIGKFYVVILALLQVGAIAIMCSAWARTTVSALIATYLVSVAFYAAPLLGALMLQEFFDVRIDDSSGIFSYIPLFLMAKKTDSGELAQLLLYSLPALVTTGGFLWLARFYLVRRAFIPATNRTLVFFRRLDAWMRSANRFVGHRTLFREGSDLPAMDPIAWREMSRKALGKPHYLLRILLVVEVPVIILCGIVYDDLEVLASIIGGLAVCALGIQAANVIVAERVNQTLEVLLTTSMTAREIVAQKARALRRFTFVLAIPLITIFAVNYLLNSERLPRLLWAAFAVAVYLPVVSWFSLWMGLKMKTRFRAIIVTLIVLFAWCVLPLVLSDTLRPLRYDSTIVNLIYTTSHLLSPASIIYGEEYQMMRAFSIYSEARGIFFSIFSGIHLAFYLGVMFFFRWLALSRANYYLRR